MKMYVLGDTHRNLAEVKRLIEAKKMRNCEIFHVGDYEVGYITKKNEIKLILEFNEWLNERGIIMYVIRGNHDDPSYFNGDHIYSNLQFLPDYTIIESEYHKILCVGGAISPDRFYGMMDNEGVRKFGLHETYFQDEDFVLREDLLNNIGGVDIVITHTAPTYCSPIVVKGVIPEIINNFLDVDSTLYDDIISEREKVDKMFKILNKKNDIRYHFYGHFHRYDITMNLYTQHIVLNKCEFYEID